jgi:hypothetical protein
MKFKGAFNLISLKALTCLSNPMLDPLYYKELFCLWLIDDDHSRLDSDSVFMVWTNEKEAQQALRRQLKMPNVQKGKVMQVKTRIGGTDQEIDELICHVINSNGCLDIFYRLRESAKFSERHISTMGELGIVTPMSAACAKAWGTVAEKLTALLESSEVQPLFRGLNALPFSTDHY